MTPRFKIDFYDSTYTPFQLCFAQRGWWKVKWKLIETFKTRDEAKAFYEQIKDLPEYLA